MRQNRNRDRDREKREREKERKKKQSIDMHNLYVMNTIRFYLI